MSEHSLGGRSKVVPVAVDGDIPLMPDASPASARPDARRDVSKRTIKTDRACRKCGYNLIGLVGDARDGVCPECGLPLAASAPTRFGDQMINAPLEWLRVFSLGASMLFFGAVVTGIAIVALSMFPLFPIALAGIAGSLMWSGGVWLTMRPRPPMPESNRAPALEWRPARMAAQITQLAWPPLVLLILMQSAAGAPLGPTPILLLIMIVLGVCGTLGLSALVGVLSKLAEWAHDGELSDRLWHCMVLAPLAVLLTLGMCYTSLSLPIGFGLVLVPLGFIVCVLWPLWYFFSSLWSLRSMAAWAVHNNLTEMDRRERAAERLARVERLSRDR